MSRRERRYVAETLRKTEGLTETIRSSAERLALENIERMSSTRDRPAGMKYFDQAATRFGEREKEIRAFKEAGGTVIGYFCSLAPVELIYAVDAMPIRLCSGLYDTVRLGEEVLPVEVCPLLKSSLGGKIAGFSPYFELCDAVISPLTCDGKTKMGEILEDWLPVLTLDVPVTKYKASSKRSWLDGIKELKGEIEDLTHREVSKEGLRSAIETVYRAQKEFRRLHGLRKAENPPIMGRDAMLVNETLAHDEIKRWTQKARELSEELEGRIAEGKGVWDAGAPRLMLTGSPIIWPNWKVPQIVEESGGIIVCDELCSSMRSFYDTVEADGWRMDGMLRAIAERYLMPSTCPCFIPSDDRVDRILELIEEFGVDGVIYHVLRGCHVYSIEATRIKKALEDKGIPLYRIESEYSLEDVGQIRTRIEAFIELLKARKEAGD